MKCTRFNIIITLILTFTFMKESDAQTTQVKDPSPSPEQSPEEPPLVHLGYIYKVKKKKVFIHYRQASVDLGGSLALSFYVSTSVSLFSRRWWGRVPQKRGGGIWPATGNKKQQQHKKIWPGP